MSFQQPRGWASERDKWDLDKAPTAFVTFGKTTVRNVIQFLMDPTFIVRSLGFIVPNLRSIKSARCRSFISAATMPDPLGLAFILSWFFKIFLLQKILLNSIVLWRWKKSVDVDSPCLKGHVRSRLMT